MQMNILYETENIILFCVLNNQLLKEIINYY